METYVDLPMDHLCGPLPMGHRCHVMHVEAYIGKEYPSHKVVQAPATPATPHEDAACHLGLHMGHIGLHIGL